MAVISRNEPDNVLRELEQKKPQLDELVHTAETLKADSNRQQLHGKGEALSSNTSLVITAFTLVPSSCLYQ
ncbi:hypothetical protein J437_LFUL015542 [Ladona fulva]|uniref:Uncharacterized protein n=1 Tax=Ladona fulva TaxID=123851 RepID=A0A8K0KGY1_LADFU|nr:hypothetical protein J437_LFUL015542 [Ladona fulva]